MARSASKVSCKDLAGNDVLVESYQEKDGIKRQPVFKIGKTYTCSIRTAEQMQDLEIADVHFVAYFKAPRHKAVLANAKTGKIACMAQSGVDVALANGYKQLGTVDMKASE